MAMELSGVDYFFQPWYAGSMGTIAQEEGEGEGEGEGDGLDLRENEAELCSSHMLHLDHTGETPFWINGGIYEIKDEPGLGYARMTHYWAGNNSEVRLIQPNWYWQGRTGCLREKGILPIADEMKKTIEMIEEEAKLVDRMIRDLDL